MNDRQNMPYTQAMLYETQRFANLVATPPIHRCKKNQLKNRKKKQIIYHTSAWRVIHKKIKIKLKESSVNFLPNTSGQEETVLIDKRIPKDTFVFAMFGSIMNDKKVFSEPEKFTPERYLNEDGITLNKVRDLVN